MDENLFSSTYANNCDLSILTLNIQSLPAKFTEFSEWISFLQHSNAEPDIICLQEIWQFPDYTLFNLPGYNEITYKLRRNNVQGGGELAST
jgi:exonuclease III